jgi:hypothetical protein
MSSHKTDRVVRVLSGALRLWGVLASVEADAQGGEFIVRAPSLTLRILPGWLVFRDEELLASHAGLPGVLRTLRRELAPHAAAGRLIIASQSLA